MTSPASIATLKDIADRAGVSLKTVSNVLNGTGKGIRVDAVERAERIRQIARQMGYRTNSSARATRTGRTGCVDLLMSTGRGFSRLTPQLIEGIHDGLAEHDYHLTVSRLPDEKLTSQGFMPKILREFLADGLLVNYTHGIPEAMLALLREYRIPSVFLNAKTGTDCVRPDDAGASELATRHLLEHGHARVAYLAFTSTGHYSEAERAEGYERAMRAAGLTPIVHTLERTPNQRIEREPGADDRLLVTAAWLASEAVPGGVTGAVCYSMAEASVLLHAAALRGVSVPGELSVAAPHDGAVSPLGRAVTTVLLPTYELGRRGVAMLMKKIERPEEALPCEALPATLVRGSTTGPYGSLGSSGSSGSSHFGRGVGAQP